MSVYNRGINMTTNREIQIDKKTMSLRNSLVLVAALICMVLLLGFGIQETGTLIAKWLAYKIRKSQIVDGRDIESISYNSIYIKLLDDLWVLSDVQSLILLVLWLTVAYPPRCCVCVTYPCNCLPPNHPLCSYG